jgi:2,3,4,5-tetrahydropyridine-2,6-dicarboxylate N-succinyltransferase
MPRSTCSTAVPPESPRSATDRWQVNEWLKKAVLLSFRIYDNQVVDGASTRYYDKVPLKFASYDDARFRAEGSARRANRRPSGAAPTSRRTPC